MFEEPKNPKVKAAYVLLSQDRQSEALDAVDEFLREDPANSEALLLKARILIRRRRFEVAETVLSEVKESSPSLVCARISLAMEREDFDAALSEASAFADREGGGTEGYRYLMFELARAGIGAIFDDKKRAAIDAMEDRVHSLWLAHSPDDAAALKSRIRRDIFDKRGDQALADALVLAEADPEDPDRQKLVLSAAIAVGDEPRMLKALEACQRLGAEIASEKRQILDHYLSLGYLPEVRKLRNLGPIRLGLIGLLAIILLGVAMVVSSATVKRYAVIFILAGPVIPFLAPILGAIKMRSVPELRFLVTKQLIWRVSLLGTAFAIGILGLLLAQSLRSSINDRGLWLLGCGACGAAVLALGIDFGLPGEREGRGQLAIGGAFLLVGILTGIFAFTAP